MFIDAIIFTYLLTGHPTYGRSCQKLLEKVEGGTIEAFISPLVIDEVSYVLMVQTARRTGSPNDARSMKKAMLYAWQDCLVPVREFHGYLDVLISKGHLKVLSLDYSISKIALECASEYRLLPRDALHTACCKAFGITEMATNDADFERVGFLNLWKP
ncbi:putative nucleic acid-binding protein [hydrocarbon metagenome]|uniref:Putative nucleic acid-binding protein n=1 Tax=hydrocarbon metagenome TaxID=938273 RepID=A0A0W8F5W4_9ZZZZ